MGASVSADSYRWTRTRDPVSLKTAFQVGQCTTQCKKKNYSACEALMLSATKAYLCNACLYDLGSHFKLVASPAWFDEIKRNKDPSAKWASLQEQLGKFVDEFVMIEFDIEKTWREQLEQRRHQTEQQIMGHESAVTGQTMPADHHQSHNAAQDAKTPGL